MAIPQHTLLDRKVVEDRIVDILETSLDTVQLMTIDIPFAPTSTTLGSFIYCSSV